MSPVPFYKTFRSIPSILCTRNINMFVGNHVCAYKTNAISTFSHYHPETYGFSFFQTFQLSANNTGPASSPSSNQVDVLPLVAHTAAGA